MSKIVFELFGSDAELVSFHADGSMGVDFIFNTPYEGFLSVGGIVARVTGGRCHFNLRLVDDGEHSVTLLSSHGSIKLPSIIKRSKEMRLADCDTGFIRSLSLRQRRLEERVKALEDRILSAEESIHKTTIF